MAGFDTCEKMKRVFYVKDQISWKDGFTMDFQTASRSCQISG